MYLPFFFLITFYDLFSNLGLLLEYHITLLHDDRGEPSACVTKE